MATLNQMIKSAVKEKEREMREKARQEKRERRLAERTGFLVLKFCRKNGIEDPAEYILDLLRRHADGGNANG